MAPNMSLFSVQAVLILSTEDGSRIFAKYFTAPHHAATDKSFPAVNPYPDLKAQKAFEKGLLEKTSKSTADIILYDNRIVLYKTEADLMIYVVGAVDENEIMLYNVVLGIRDTLHLLFKQQVDKRTLVENYDMVSLAIDEIVDDGIILETDPLVVVTRCSRAPAQDQPQLTNIDLSEEGINNLANFGKKKLGDWLRNM